MDIKSIQAITTKENKNIEIMVEGGIYPEKYIPYYLAEFIKNHFKFPPPPKQSHLSGKKRSALRDSNTEPSYSYVLL